MSKTKLSMSISLDGYVAGPGQDEDDPLGRGGEDLHGWMFGSNAEHPANAQVREEILAGMGATIMGRNMFGPVRGEWGDSEWAGWWGDEPPYHCPVFVLTHHGREPVEMKGGTTFHFVTGGIEAAHEEAKAVAADEDISIAGGASCARQYLAAGLIDEIDLQIAPLLLGDGERLFEGFEPGQLNLEVTRVLEAPGATHISYSVGR